MPPTWLTVLAWIALVVAFVCAAAIAWDIAVRGHRQKMAVMNILWPVTALYLGPLANVAYRRWGRPDAPHKPRRTSCRSPRSRSGCSAGWR